MRKTTRERNERNELYLLRMSAATSQEERDAILLELLRELKYDPVVDAYELAKEGLL